MAKKANISPALKGQLYALEALKNKGWLIKLPNLIFDYYTSVKDYTECTGQVDPEYIKEDIKVLEKRLAKFKNIAELMGVLIEATEVSIQELKNLESDPREFADKRLPI